MRIGNTSCHYRCCSIFIGDHLTQTLLARYVFWLKSKIDYGERTMANELKAEGRVKARIVQKS